MFNTFGAGRGHPRSKSWGTCFTAPTLIEIPKGGSRKGIGSSTHWVNDKRDSAFAVSISTSLQRTMTTGLQGVPLRRHWYPAPAGGRRMEGTQANSTSTIGKESHMNTQTPVRPITTEPATPPRTTPDTPGTTAPGARVLAVFTACAVSISPAGAGTDVSRPLPAQIPGQLSLLDRSEVLA